MTKIALLIGVSDYEPGLNPLPGSVLDVDAMQRVLSHSAMGGFAAADITVLKNPQRQDMEEAIYRLFADRKKDDLLLLYFSGHGIKDENGRLYLATRTTRKENGRLVNPSAVAAAYLHDRINDSRSQRQVIILDCCFSGAIAQGMTVKDDGTVDLQASLGGRGRAILTSSTSVEYSFGAEGSGYVDGGLSVYTRYLVQGIETGAADIDGDGFIAVEELHEYASSQVREAAPAMTPKFYPVEEGYKIILAKSPKDDPKLKFRKEVQARAKQGQGQFSVFAQRMLEGKRREWGILPEEAEAIQAEVLQPYREYEQKCQDYEQALIEAANLEYPFSTQTEADLLEYRQHLSLRSEDWEVIETRVLTPFKQSIKTQVTQSFKPLESDPIPLTIANSTPPESPSTSTEVLPTTEEFFERGYKKHIAGDYQGAIADLTEAIRLQPDNAAAYYNRGVDKSALDDKQGAIADLTEAIRLQPDFANAYYFRGIAKSALDDYQEAIKDCTEAIRLKPDYADAYYYRGIAKSALDDKQGAIADFSEVIRLQSDYADAYYFRGIAKGALRDYQGAVADYTEAIRLQPNFADAYNDRGTVKFVLSDPQGAIADYTEAIRSKPDHADAYYGRGLVRFVLGDKQGAIADYREAARLYQQQGKTEDYRDALNQIAKLEKEGKGFFGRFFS